MKVESYIVLFNDLLLYEEKKEGGVEGKGDGWYSIGTAIN